ncbi:MAG: phage major capsid protein [Deltaproteobacteria bacterium]|nr:phage major capsid protein [Deltaproteobacteria bacterium]
MFGEKIKNLQGLIEAKLTEIETLQTLVESENRGFSEDEAATRSAAITEIAALQKRKADLEETESLVSQRAAPAAPGAPGAPGAPAPAPMAAYPVPATPITGGSPVKDADASLFFAKQAHALFITGGNRYAAAQYSKDSLGDELLAKTFLMPADIVHRAAVAPADSTTSGWAAELVQVNQASAAFIELLRNVSIVAGFPSVRRMSFDGYGSIKVPRQTGGTSGNWVGEGSAIPVDALAFDDVTLDPKKNAVIVVSTAETLRRSDPSALALIRDDLIAGISQSIDTKYVSADAVSAGVSPAGIQTFDSSSTASGGDTLDLITADLKVVIGAMNTNNLTDAGRVWVMNPARKLSLSLIRDGLGTYAFRDELASGTLMGYPVLTSNTVTATVVMLVHAPSIVIASELAPQISISMDASLEVDDAPAGSLDTPTTATQAKSMFQMDMVAIRALTTLDWAARRAQATEVLTSVSW